MNTRMHLTVSLLWLAACGGTEAGGANASYCRDNGHDLVACEDPEYELSAALDRALELAGDDAVLYGVINNSAAGPFTGDANAAWILQFLRGNFTVTMGVRATAGRATIHTEGIVESAEFDCSPSDALAVPDPRPALRTAVDTVESELGEKLTPGNYTLSYNYSTPCHLVSAQAAYGEARVIMQLATTVSGKPRIWNIHTSAEGKLIESCEGQRRQVTCPVD